MKGISHPGKPGNGQPVRLRQYRARYPEGTMTRAHEPIRRVAVFCGSSFGGNSDFRTEAATLGAAIARAGLVLVYGGTCRGLMGAVADAALAQGGEVIGVLPDELKGREIAHNGLTSLELVPSMHERKARIHELSGAFLVLPGGFGTFEELLEAITWAQIGLHAKPCILINTAGYWNGLLAFLDTAVAEGFIEAKNRKLVRVAANAAEALRIAANPV